ncbi:MAG: Na+/H+ antiporter NhaA [Phycisphaerales bacterium]
MAHAGPPVRLQTFPRTPAERLSAALARFASMSAAGGVVLVAVTVVAMVWANSPWATTYEWLFHELYLVVRLGEFGWKASVVHWINDLLMAVFFFFVGLEIKREVLFGELRSMKRAALPLFGAAGGMAVPGAIYAIVNLGGDGLHGWGIPTATDIAFALGIMALLGSRVPAGLKLFLTTLAVADDLGALLVIAVFYTESPSVANLFLAMGALAVMFAMNRLGVRSALPYVLAGGVVWWFIHNSGVHATIAGVLTAMSIPSDARTKVGAVAHFVRETAGELERTSHAASPMLSGNQQAQVDGIQDACTQAQSPLQRLEHKLVPWVGFFIVPLFALANAGVPLSTGDTPLAAVVSSRECLGVALGLIIGKPVGILVASFAAVRLGAASLPSGVTMHHVHGAAWLGGIGFTMSLFIANLAFVRGGEVNTAQLNAAKVGILAGSTVAAVVGLLVLRRATRPRPDGN